MYDAHDPPHLGDEDTGKLDLRITEAMEKYGGKRPPLSPFGRRAEMIRKCEKFYRAQRKRT